MINWLFRISVTLGLVGMISGMVMGMTQNFILAPAHAHLLLLGFVAMFLSALYYRSVPEAAASRLAPLQAFVSVAGSFLFPIGIVCIRLGDRARFKPVLIAGQLTVIAGMLLFAIIVYRSSGRASRRRVQEPSPAPGSARFSAPEGVPVVAQSASAAMTKGIASL